MDYSKLDDKEYDRLMKNNTIVDGRSLDYCYSLLLEKDDLESKRVAGILADRMDQNIEKMIMRRGIELTSQPLSQFLSQQEPEVSGIEKRMEKKLKDLEDKLSKLSYKPSKLRRQITNR